MAEPADELFIDEKVNPSVGIKKIWPQYLRLYLHFFLH
jgi:hypothetical protein